MSRALTRLTYLIAAGLCLASGQLLKGPPKDPDVLLTLTEIAGAFIVFLGWAICVFAWGRWLTRKLELENAGLGTLGPSMALGAASVSAITYALGLLGLIGYDFQPLQTLILFAGPVLELRSRPEETGAKEGRWQWPELLILAVIVSQIGERLTLSSLANGSTDPPMYHLLAPRYWVEIGRISFRPDWPATFHASWWEYLYIWGNTLLGGPKGLGLIESQLFGQWTHATFGFCTTIALAFALQRSFGASRPWALTGCLALFYSTAQRQYTELAKNDYGIEAWSLLAAGLILTSKERTPKRLLLSGLLAGMAVGGKAVVVISLAPWVLIWVVSLFVARIPRKEVLAAVGWVAVGGLATVLPIYIRNFWFTGNPFFPLADGLFPSPWMTEYVRSSVQVFAGHRFRPWGEFETYLMSAVKDAPFNLLALLLIPLAAKGYASRRQALATVGSVTSVVFYCSWRFFNSFLRWLAPSLAFLQFGGIMALEAFARIFIRSPKAVSALALVPAALITWGLDGPLGPWRALVNGPSPTVVWRIPTVVNGGDARAWLRMNVKPDELIVSLGDPGFYYNYYQRITLIVTNPAFDRYLLVDGGLKALVRMLRSYGVKYTVDVFHWNNMFYNPVGAKIDRAAYAAWDPIVYEGKDSIIIDMELLEDSLERACVPPHPADDDFLIP